VSVRGAASHAHAPDKSQTLISGIAYSGVQGCKQYAGWNILNSVDKHPKGAEHD
jgi:hypothetical protein